MLHTFNGLSIRPEGVLYISTAAPHPQCPSIFAVIQIYCVLQLNKYRSEHSFPNRPDAAKLFRAL